jgi:hypothetical protein
MMKLAPSVHRRGFRPGAARMLLFGLSPGRRARLTVAARDSNEPVAR